MTRQIRSLAKHTGVYGAGTVVGGMARVALVPIIARYVPADEYGKASVVLILISLLGIVSELGLSSSLIKFANEVADEEQRRRVISTIVTGSLFVALPIAVVAGLLVGVLSRLLLGSGDYRMLVLVGVAGGFGNAVLQIGLAFERALARSTRYFRYTLIKGVLSLVISIALVVVLKRGAMGLLVGAALPPLAIGIAIYVRLLTSCGASFSRSIFRSVFEFGGPLVPMNLAMWVLTSMDIYLLRRFAATSGALSEVGLYQYAHEICLLLALPVTALNLAWPQFIFSNYARPEGRDLFARVHTYFAFFLIEIAFLMSAFSRQIVSLAGLRSPRYLASAGVIPLLAGSLVFYGLSIVFASGLYLKGKTHQLAMVVAACAALNVALNIVLIPRMGKEGAALAVLVTNLLMMASVLVFAQMAFPIPFRLGRTFAGIVVGSLGIAALAFATRGHPVFAGYLPRLLASLGFTAVLVGFLRVTPAGLGNSANMLLRAFKPPTA